MKSDVLVIGGSASGITTALTGKARYPDKEFLVVRKEKEVFIPCGIPYIFGSLENSGQDVIPDQMLTNAGIKLMLDEISSIDCDNKLCKTSNGEEISFEKLVIATGSRPVIPGWLKGADLENVFTIPKDKEYIDKAITTLENAQKIVVIGGGFIGVEMSDELNKKGKDVTIVEVLPHLLGLVFDDEVTAKVEEVLSSRGIHIKTGSGVKEILGTDGKVSEVELQSGEKLEADAVILSMGYRPNTKLAQDSGIDINKFGFIEVDEYMRTGKPDILAVGDCAEKRDFITRKLSCVMLASVACAESRVAAINLYNLSNLKTFSGTIPVFFTAVGNNGFGAAGITEKLAKREGLDVVTASFEGVDRHPGKLSDMHPQTVKLVVAKRSGIVLGGSVVGGLSTGELVNLIGVAIQNRMTVNSVFTTQMGSHPLLTASPAAYPLIKAAEIALGKIG
jgi:NADH oxidase (H2O2-forming)